MVKQFENDPTMEMESIKELREMVKDEIANGGDQSVGNAKDFYSKTISKTLVA